MDKPRVTLVGGRVVSSWSEEWRSECEARFVLTMPYLADRRNYLADIQKKRGWKAYDALKATMMAVHTNRREAS